MRVLRFGGRWEHNRLLPFERCGFFVVDLHKIVDGFTELLGRGKTGASNGLSTEDAEPAFHLIEPRRIGWDEMETHPGVALQPTVVFGLVVLRLSSTT